MAKPALSIVTTGDLGRVYDEQDQINVKYWETNIPLTPTEGRISLNIGGKTRIIMIQGANDGASFTGGSYDTQDKKLKGFVEMIEAWTNSAVNLPAIYTDSMGRTFNVDCIDFQTRRSFSDPNRIIYSLIMKQTIL